MFLFITTKLRHIENSIVDRMHEQNLLGKKLITANQEAAYKIGLVYWTKQMDKNGPKRSSRIDGTGGLAQVAISWSDTKTVGPGPTDLHLFQSLHLSLFIMERFDM